MTTDIHPFEAIKLWQGGHRSFNGFIYGLLSQHWTPT